MTDTKGTRAGIDDILSEVMKLLPTGWHIASISREYGGGATVEVQNGISPSWARTLGEKSEPTLIHVTIRGNDEDIRAQLPLLSNLNYLTEIPKWTSINILAVHRE